MPHASRFRLAVPLVAAVFAGCAAASNPEVDLAAEEQALRAATHDLVAREAARDVDGALDYYTDDAVAHLANQPPVSGKQNLGALYQDFFDMGLVDLQSTISGIMLATSGDLAVEYGVNHIRFATPDGEVTDVGKYTAVWKKVDGRWKVALISVSSDAPPPSLSPNQP